MTYGQVEFTTPGVTEWTVPDGVTSISAVCVGGGGAGHGATGATGSGGSAGGGGALNWTNNHPVLPGEVLTIGVAQGGIGATGIGTSGGDSFIASGAAYICLAKGGAAGNTSTVSPGGKVEEGFPSNQGGTGGTGGGSTNRQIGNGAGGAGGYTGTGGWGSTSTGSGAAGAGGAGGGGGRPSELNGGGGGGVGLLGQGSNGAGGSSTNGDQFGRGGSGGNDANDLDGGLYGGGGGSPDDAIISANGGNGGNGAVRIMYGDSRTFPNDAADVEPPPPDATDLFLVNGIATAYTSTVAYTSKQFAVDGVTLQLNFPDGWTGIKDAPLFPGGFLFDTYRTFQSDANGNDLGTAEGTLYNITWLGGSDSVTFIQVNNTTSTDWASSGYVTFIVNDLSKSAQVQRQNLWHADLQDSIVLVNEGSQSYHCPIKDLPNKATDSRIMLVNKGGISYQTKTTDVVASYVPPLPPLPTPYMDFNANNFGAGSSIWVDSSGNGRNMTFSASPQYVGTNPQQACRFVPNDWGYVINLPSLPTRTHYCYEAWVKCSAQGTANPICQWTENSTSTNPSSYDMHLYHFGGTQMVSGLWDGSTRTVNTAVDNTLNTQFNHIVTYFDGTSVKLYVNGNLIGTSANTNGINTSNLRTFRIGGTKIGGWPGANSVGNPPNCGAFDLQRLRVWIGEYLSEEEIEGAYQEFLSMQ